MRLRRHATPARNLPSILRHGLLVRKSRGALRAIWMVSPAKTSWAVLHTVKRHAGRVEEVVVLEVSVPRSWLRKSRRSLWYCTKDIPPSRIKAAFTFSQLAEPPVERVA